MTSSAALPKRRACPHHIIRCHMMSAAQLHRSMTIDLR